MPLCLRASATATAFLMSVVARECSWKGQCQPDWTPLVSTLPRKWLLSRWVASAKIAFVRNGCRISKKQMPMTVSFL